MLHHPYHPLNSSSQFHTVSAITHCFHVSARHSCPRRLSILPCRCVAPASASIQPADPHHHSFLFGNASTSHPCTEHTHIDSGRCMCSFLAIVAMLCICCDGAAQIHRRHLTIVLQRVLHTLTDTPSPPLHQPCRNLRLQLPTTPPPNRCFCAPHNTRALTPCCPRIEASCTMGGAWRGRRRLLAMHRRSNSQNMATHACIYLRTIQ